MFVAAKLLNYAFRGNLLIFVCGLDHSLKGWSQSMHCHTRRTCLAVVMEWFIIQKVMRLIQTNGTGSDMSLGNLRLKSNESQATNVRPYHGLALVIQFVKVFLSLSFGSLVWSLYTLSNIYSKDLQPFFSTCVFLHKQSFHLQDCKVGFECLTSSLHCPFWVLRKSIFINLFPKTCLKCCSVGVHCLIMFFVLPISDCSLLVHLLYKCVPLLPVLQKVWTVPEFQEIQFGNRNVIVNISKCNRVVGMQSNCELRLGWVNATLVEI